MIKRPHYIDVKYYDEKLPRVMSRLGIDTYYPYHDSEGGFIQFTYKKEHYKFDNSIDKAKNRNIELENGDAAFIQLVLALEDLARLVERGIYDLQSWIEGMKMLPAPKDKIFLDC